MATPKIVILGAGYGGLVTAVTLQKQLNYNEADVILVNKHDYHYITTGLHEPAAGTRNADKVKVDINSIIDSRKITLKHATVSSINPETKSVLLEGGEELSYEHLVIGLGSDPETFGIPGLKENAFNIRSVNSVQLIKEHIEYMFSRYKNEPNHDEYLTFIIGGAGFTGIEFVAELADRIPELCKEFDVDRSKVKLINIEAGPGALPGFDPALVEYAVQVLERKGVQFMINTPIKECTVDSVILGTGEEIKTGTVISTLGVRGNSIIDAAGFETMRGRVKVDEYLRAPNYEDVYIVGDSSLIFNEEGRPYPTTAQMAMQQGDFLGHNLVSSLRGGSVKTFTYKSKGTVASLGKNEAIGFVGKYKLYGFMASVMKKVIDIRYLFIIGGIPLVLKKGKFI